MTITTDTAATLGERGGKNGRGKSKRRGNAAYYKRLAAKRWNKPRQSPTQPQRRQKR